MNVLKLFPVVLSFLLLAAHFYRAGHLIITALCIGVLFLLFLRESWVPRMFQVLLILGALEWLRTLYSIASIRVAFEQDWTRLAVILGAVALLTALSGLVFKSEGVRARYRSLG